MLTHTNLNQVGKYWSVTSCVGIGDCICCEPHVLGLEGICNIIKD